MAQVEKIYKLSTLGFDQIMTELDALSKKFVEIKKAKQDAAKTAADTAKNVGIESDAYKAAAKALEEVKIKELELAKSIKEKTNEAKAGQLARQEDINQQKAAINGNTAEINSIGNIRKARAELNAAIIGTRVGAPVEFRGLILPYQQANDTLKRLTDQSNAYTRQFQKDGTLVGEYTTGIIKAFNKMGIGDLVEGQVTKANNQLRTLNQQFEALKGELTTIKNTGHGVFDRIATELNAVKASGVSGFESIAAKIREIGTTGGSSLQNIEIILQEIRGSGTSAFKGIEQELLAIKAAGAGSFDNLERSLLENRRAAMALETEVGRLQVGLRGTGDIGNQITTALANGFKEMKGQLANFVLGYVGFQAAFSGITKLVTENENLSDSIAQLQIYLKGSKTDADNLVESLKQINTRTSLASLIDIGTVIAKKGVAKEEIAGVTKAVDDLMLTLGKEIGDPHEAVSSLVKLVNVYSEDKHVTAENIDRIGGAIARLTSSGVATGSFLINFAERLAGVRGLTGLTIDKVLGLGAALEELGQRTETSASSVSQLVVKIFSDVPKYAKLAGIEVQKFRDIITKDPVEGLLAFADAIKKNAKGAEEAAQAFGDANIRGQRAVLVFGDIAANADYVRKRVGAATVAMNEHGIAAASAAIKQNTFAASVDRIKKSFEVAGADTGLAKFFSLLGTTIEYVIKLFFAIPFGIVLTGLGLMTAAWAYYKGNLIAATLAQSANNEATLLGSVRLAIMRSGLAGAAAAERARAIASAAASAQRVAALEEEIAAELSAVTALEAKIAADAEQSVVLGAEIAARRAHVISLEAEVVAMEGATVATEGLNIATRASPIGVILTLVAIAIPALAAFGRGNEDAAKKVSILSDGLRIQGDIQASMRDQTTKTKNSVNELINIIKTEVDNQDLRKKAYQELIKIAPEFRDTLDAEFKATGNLIEVYDKYIAQLDKVSRAQAIKTLKQKYDNDLAEKQNNEFQAKIAADEEARQNKVTQAANKNIAVEGLSGNSLGASGAAFAKIQKVQTEKQDAYKKATEEAKKARDAAKSFTEFMKSASDEDKQALIEGTGGGATPAPTTGGDIGLDELKKQLASVNAQIASMDKIRVKTKIQMTQLKDLRKERADLLKQIKELGGSISAPRADTLSGGDKDVLAQEDTRRDLLLTLEKKTRVTNQEDEETYLKNVLKINQDSIDRKINLIKGDGIAEQKLRAQLSLDRITLEKDTQSKIQEIHNKEFTDRQTALKNQLDEDVAAVKQADAIIQNDPNKSSTDKAQSKLTSDSKILELYRTFNVNVDRIEKEFAQQTTRNSREIVKAQQQTSIQIISDRREVENARLTDIQTESDAEITEINIGYEKTRTSILQNEKLTSTQRQTLLENLNSANNITVLSKELETLTEQLRHKALLYAQNDISDEEYEKARLAALKKKGELEAAVIAANNKKRQDAINNKPQDVAQLASGAIAGAFGYDKDSPEGKLIGKETEAAFGLATDAMHNYYDAERARIQQSLQLNLARLDLEEQQVKARAQSQAEIDSIDKQYAAKKSAAQKAAGEEMKKSKKAELKIALVTEIANDAVSAARFPPPFNLIIFGIMSALALGRYALGVSQINAQQFAYGGDVPKRGGKFGGKPHSQGGTKFGFQHEQYEAEVDELAIIRTRNAPARNKVFQIQGTHQQIASQLNVIGGGVSFAPGAKLKKFDLGGSLATTLQAPVFTPSSNSGIINNSNGVSKDQFETLIGKIDTMNAETSKRFERIEVVQVTSSVTKAQQKQVTQRAIGTL